MKKNILIISMLLIAASPCLSFATTSDSGSIISDGNPKVAIVEDLMKDMVKRTIYSLGTKVLDKYMNPNNTTYTNNSYNYTPSTAPANDQQPATTTTTTQQTTDGTGNYVPPEPMIPVS